MVKPMTAAAYLAMFHPDVLWVLTAIEPNQKGIVTKAFDGPSAADEAQAWIAERDGKQNLYYSVAEVIDPADKKASRKNVKAVHYLHVDLDAEYGRPLDDELARIKRLLTTKLPESIPKPTIIVFSGGGYQAFWKLDEPIPINGNLEAAEMAAAYNKQLELVLGGDSCHNVDRIMRLPFTQNIPNARKLAKGRRQVEAAVVSFTKATYNLSQFKAAVDQGAVPSSDVGVEVSGNVRRLATIDDLDEWKVPDSLKVIAVQGLIPDEPKDGDNSRSAWVFHLACGLVRYEVPDDVIYSVLTDPGFKISESVLEANNPHKYAVKQIKSAKEAAVSEWLARLNARYAVIGNLGGKCRVIEEVHDPLLNRHILVKQTFEDFRNRYSNMKEQVVTENTNGEPVIKVVPVGKFWLDHPQRRQYDRLIFFPGGDVEGCYNLWRGFDVPAIKGTGHESFLGHIKNIICSGNEVHYRFLIQWLATMVRDPARPGEIAFVMRGLPGTGKGFFVRNIGALFGRHFLHATSTGQIVGNFNNHLRDAVVVFADEALCTGDPKSESALKSLITEPTLQVEAKGVDAETCPNFTHIFMASNSEWVVPVGTKDRRYFVVDVDESRERDEAYFGQIQRDLNGGGAANLLYHLMHEVDTTGFSTQRIPSSEGRTSQQIESLSSVERRVYDLLIDGEVPSNMKVDADGAFFVSAWLISKWGAGFTATALTKELKRMRPKGSEPKAKEYIGKIQKRGVRVPTLPDARRYWALSHGFEEADLEWADSMDDSWAQDIEPERDTSHFA